MKRKVQQSHISNIYAVNNEETPSSYEDNNGKLKGVFGKLFSVFGSKERNNNKNNYSGFNSINEENQGFVHDIMDDNGVKDIKNNIGEDKTLREICFIDLRSFKSSLLKLTKISNEEYIYMINVLIEENVEDSMDKFLFIVSMNENIVNYKESVLLKSLPIEYIKKVSEVTKLEKVKYQKSKSYEYNNKVAVFLFEEGLLTSNSHVDLEFYKVEKLKELSKKYGVEYTLPFVKEKFEQSNFLNFNQVKALFDLGLDLNIVDNKNKNAYWFVKTLEDIQYLIDKGVNINHLNDVNENFLFDFLRENHNFNLVEKEIIQYLYDHDFNFNTISKKGENILFVAARKSKDCLQYFLNMNLIDYHQRNIEGENILFLIEDQKTLSVLVEELGLNIHIINNKGENLLFNRGVESVALLIEMGVNKKHKNYQGENYLPYIKK